MPHSPKPRVPASRTRALTCPPSPASYPSPTPALSVPPVSEAPPGPDAPPGPEPAAAAYDEVVAALRSAGCVFAEDEARLLLAAAHDARDLAARTARRASGLPLEHVLGWAEFAGRRIAVDAGVFVPRRRTEFLAARAVACGRAVAQEHAAGVRRPVVLDLCCGTGALGVVLAADLPCAEVHACDLDPAAVVCARRNLASFGGTVHHGDLFAPLPAFLRGRVDVLVANMPYVPSGELGLLPAEAREYEAPMALDGGADGLDVLRRVAPDAAGWLAPGGALLFETSERQAGRAVRIIRAVGLRPRLDRDRARCVTVVTGVRSR